MMASTRKTSEQIHTIARNLTFPSSKSPGMDRLKTVSSDSIKFVVACVFEATKDVHAVVDQKALCNGR